MIGIIKGILCLVLIIVVCFFFEKNVQDQRNSRVLEETTRQEKEQKKEKFVCYQKEGKKIALNFFLDAKDQDFAEDILKQNSWVKEKNPFLCLNEKELFFLMPCEILEEGASSRSAFIFSNSKGKKIFRNLIEFGNFLSKDFPLDF